LAKRLQVLAKNIQSTQAKDENFQFFKYLNIIMDKYVLHSIFYAIDMDDVDIVLGYSWMDLVGTVNINVKKKFLKLWYKKNKITFQDISITTQEGPKEAHKEELARELILVPHDTLDEESMVESYKEPLETLEEKTKEGCKQEEEDI
jgi:hypothetical protein